MGLRSDSLPTYAFLGTIIHFKKRFMTMMLHDISESWRQWTSAFSPLSLLCYFILASGWGAKTAQLHWALLLPPVEAGRWPEWPSHYTLSEATLNVELSWRPLDPNSFTSWWRRDPDPRQSLCKWERNLYYMRQKWLSSLNVIWFGKNKTKRELEGLQFHSESPQ